MGPGLGTMVGDNDAGGIATYTQAGQNYGTSLLSTSYAFGDVFKVNHLLHRKLSDAKLF
jgi:hypothetical protein